jgi:arylsulfatase A-like enzyme
MKHSRGAAVTAGVYAGALLGSIAGLLEAASFLDSSNLTTTPWRSIMFVLLAMALYAVVMSALGAFLGFLASFLPYHGRKGVGGPYGYPFAVVFGAVLGALVFAPGAWWVRIAPPDLSIFRRDCRTETLLVILISVVIGRVAFHLVRRISRRERVERYFASRWARGWTFAKLAAAVVLLVAVLRTEGGARVTGNDGRYNVILITVDTLRTNHLEYMGYDKPTSPLTKRLAPESVVFRECVAQYPLTTPSHASILSARYVRSHGAVANAVPIDDSVKLLSQVLKENGYSTSAFVTSAIIGRKYGFDRGFDHFVEPNSGDFTKSSLSEWIGQLRLARIWWRLHDVNFVTVASERWLSGRPKEPFFLWLHYVMPHASYAPPFSYERRWDTYPSKIVASIRELEKVGRGQIVPNETDVKHITALYDAEIEFTEDLLARVLSTLDRIGARDNTLIVFTADHGESLYDREVYFGHGKFLYDEEIIIPLLFHCPSALPAGMVIEEPVESIHIAPTVLDFLGLPAERSFQGMSLMSLIDPERVRAEAGGTRPEHPTREKPAFSINHRSKMVRFGGWKYIEVEDDLGTEELYDLVNDPGETKNAVLTETAKAAELRALLREWDASVPVIRSESYKLDDESVRALRALGYVD